MTLLAATYDLKIIRGGTFRVTFAFFTDTKQTDPLDMSDWTGLVAIEAPANLSITEGNGLVLGADGTAVLTLTSAQTAIPGEGVTSAHWYMKLVDPTGADEFPVAGTAIFRDP